MMAVWLHYMATCITTTTAATNNHHGKWQMKIFPLQSVGAAAHTPTPFACLAATFWAVMV